MKYNEKIAAQVAAYFIDREGGLLNIMKLVKLMYLAERESLRQYGEPIVGDILVSMPYGPVMSTTLNHINGSIPSIHDGWDDWISDRESHNVSVKGQFNLDNLFELSEADVMILDITYKTYGDYDQFQLCNHTHEHCGEWENPRGSSSDIPYDRLLKNVGYSSEAALQISRRIDEQKSLDNLLSIKG